MRAIAAVAFVAGLLVAVRVMLFGVQRRVDEETIRARGWPLALAALLAVSGALLYARPGVTLGWIAVVFAAGVLSATAAWWLVHRSASTPSTDPEDDPRFRFQGHVARVIEPLRSRPGDAAGRIRFDFDGKMYELAARWLPGDWSAFGDTDTEVVIERVEEEIAYVEPWSVVEQRL